MDNAWQEKTQNYQGTGNLKVISRGMHSPVSSILNEHKQNKTQKIGSTVRWKRKTAGWDGNCVILCLIH